MEYQYYAQPIYRIHAVKIVYGAEAVLPSDIRHDSPRVTAYIEADNDTTRQDALDRLDEERDIAAT